MNPARVLFGKRTIPVPEFLGADDWRATEQAFFAGLLLRNGVYKTTVEHRMDALLPPLVGVAAELGGPVRVLDVACSSGISTLELHQALAGAGIAAETVGTDLCMFARYARRGDGTALLLDPDRQPIQIEIGDWASPWRWRPRDRVLRPWFVARGRRIVHEVGTFPEGDLVALLSRSVQNVPGLSFAQENVLAPHVPGKFGVVRAANLLNPSYFTDDELRPMIRALVDRLADPGFLQLARTDTAGVHRATVFRHSGGRLEVVSSVNGGSEVAHLLP